MKINLKEKALDIEGKDVIDLYRDDKGTEIKRARTMKDNLLRLLSSQFDGNIMSGPRDYTNIYTLSQKINKNDGEIEISNEKIDFLKKLIKHNKTIYFVKAAHGLVRQDRNLFTPFEAGQLLHFLGEKGEKEDNK